MAWWCLANPHASLRDASLLSLDLGLKSTATIIASLREVTRDLPRPGKKVRCVLEVSPSIGFDNVSHQESGMSCSNSRKLQGQSIIL